MAKKKVILKAGDIVIPQPNAKELTQLLAGWNSDMDNLVGKKLEVKEVGTIKVYVYNEYKTDSWTWHKDCLKLYVPPKSKTKASSKKMAKKTTTKCKPKPKVKDGILNEKVKFKACGIDNVGVAILKLDDSGYLLLLGKDGHKGSDNWQYGKLIEECIHKYGIAVPKQLINKYKGRYVLLVYKSNIKKI
jgi:hypothetical protein